jgi:hypothetical protein
LAVLLLVAATAGSWRLVAAAFTSGLLTLFAEGHHSPWVWYGPVVVMLLVVAALAVPSRRASEPKETDGPDERDEMAMSVARQAGGVAPLPAA